MVAIDDEFDSGEIEESFCSTMGHEFRFQFSVLDLVNKQEYILKKNIETKCQTLSTSWTLEFIFKQALDTSVASCALTAKRTDSMNETVKASIEMSYSYVEYQSYELQELYTNEFRPEEEMKGFCANVLPSPQDSALYLDGGITVGVKLAVKCCERDE